MQIKKYIIKIILFGLLLFFIDSIIGFFLIKYYFTQQQGDDYVLTRTIENPTNQKADVLIFGSSKAKRNYNPQIISDSLNLTCYNAGYDGMGILYSNALFDIIEEKYCPEIIILDIISDELDYSPASYDQLSVLSPYVDKYPILWKTLLLRSPFEKIKHISGIYPYNSMLHKIIEGNMNKYGGEKDINGFTPKYGIWNDTLRTVSFGEVKLDSNKINALNAFLKKCIDRKLKVYVVFSPEYRMFLEDSKSIVYIKKKCKELNVKFVTYENNEKFFNNALFFDQRHLNNFGAELFSKDVSSILR
jgi:hypothetical protein